MYGGCSESGEGSGKLSVTYLLDVVFWSQDGYRQCSYNIMYEVCVGPRVAAYYSVDVFVW